MFLGKCEKVRLFLGCDNGCIIQWDEFKCKKLTYNDQPKCCDRKAPAACAQSFALSQQATIEFTRWDRSIIACSRHIYTVLFFAHIPFVVNHAFSATPTERLQHKRVERFDPSYNIRARPVTRRAQGSEATPRKRGFPLKNVLDMVLNY